MDITAQEILNSLFNPDDKVCLRVFDDKKRGVFAGQKLSVECGKFSSMREVFFYRGDAEAAQCPGPWYFLRC